MVLYKRKQVQITLPVKVPEDLSTEVWYIPETQEWFTEYEDYLNRMDYYQRRKFVCEITGNSCLTFFEALKSEIKEVKDVEKNFPEALKTHILRFLQFNRITRLDQLVDKVYSQFKNNYFPGEYILLRGVVIGGGVGEVSAMKHKAIIREKVEFPGAPAKYLVVRLNDNKDTIATGDKLARDRNHFTKWLIKTFIKLTMTRSHKIGAPWVVKDKYAKRYRIDQKYPPDLQQYEASTAAYDDPHDMDPGSMRHFTVVVPRPPAPKTASPAPPRATQAYKFRDEHTSAKKLHKQLDLLRSITPENFESDGGSDARSKVSLDHLVKGPSQPPEVVKPTKSKKFPIHYLPVHLREIGHIKDEGVNCNRPGTIATLQANGIPPTRKNMVDDLKIKFDLQHTKPVPHKFKLPSNSKYWNQHLLNLIEKKERAMKKSQSSEDVKKEAPEKEEDVISVSSDDEKEFEGDSGNDLLALDKEKLKSEHLQSIEDALETWIFLNIYHSALKIDTFTFDDFIYAMGWHTEQFDEQGRCQLLDEIWCSVLCQIVSNKLPSAAESRALDSDEVYGLKITVPSTVSYINPKTEDDEALVKGSESEAENNGKSFSDAEEEENSDSDGARDTDSKKKTSVKKEDEVIEVPDNDNDADDEDDEGMVTAEEEAGKSDDEKEEDEEDEEPRDHNAYQIMNHRGISWHDRLRKRNFRDGNWQTILLGVLSLVDHIPKFQDTIERVYKVMAPVTEPATATTALNQFYGIMDINLRLQTLNILCSLLTTTDMVRSYIDKGLEESTVLRRKRLDNIKEFKTALDQAQKVHNSILEQITKDAETTEAGEEIKKKHKFDVNQKELTEAESKLADQDQSFGGLCNERKQLFEKIDELKKEKKSFERQLVELDCQRVRCLGKDRLHNRYWWFENNGLPTLHGTAEADDDNEDEKMDEDNDSSEDVQEETYLMGKLWIQGPCAEDARLHFSNTIFESDSAESHVIKTKNDDPDIIDFDGNVVDKLDFSQLPADFVKFAHDKCSLQINPGSVSKTDSSQVVDSLGELSPNLDYTTLSPMERKVLEEMPDPLFDGSQWRYYDKTDEIDTIIKWLNPYGVRESQLKKELLSVRDAISFSINARNKALSSKDHIEEQDAIREKIKKVEERINASVSEGYAEEEDDDVEDVTPGRKRNLRVKSKANKRQKRSSEDIIENGSVEELKELKEDLEKEIKDLEEQKDASRALEWVNSLAIEEFDKSLYDGGDRAKAKSKNGKK